MLQTEICIVGAGLSGLALASFIRKEQPETRLLILEQSDSPGGTIQTFRQDGWLAEYGPHGFLDNCPEGQELIRLAGLEEEHLLAPLSRFVRYLCLNGRLAQVPQTPPKILMAPLMGWKDKFGLAARDLTRPFLAGEPTVAEWISHRFGPAMLPFADAVYTGTYAGDIGRLRIDGVMPALRRLEQEHGSVIRALFARMREKKQERRARGEKRRGLPAMQSFREGMVALPQALAARLQEDGLVRFKAGVQAIAPSSSGWTVQTPETGVQCRDLVLALPVNAALALTKGLLPAPPAAELPEARLASVLLGFGPEAQIPFGFGYLAPEQEGRFALGALFSTRMFPGRAPQDGQLLEVLVGGRRHPERLELDDRDIITQALADLRELIHLPAEPRFSAVLRCEAGIPQAEAEYLRLLEWREQALSGCPGLHLLGFGWGGIGLNDMIREAKKLALRLLSRPTTANEALKGVYV